jgi:hypothetical protein
MNQPRLFMRWRKQLAQASALASAQASALASAAARS